MIVTLKPRGLLRATCRLHPEHGGVFAEYAIAAAVLVPIFLTAAVLLQNAVVGRSAASLKTVEQTTPESSILADFRVCNDQPIIEDTSFLDDHGAPNVAQDGSGCGDRS
jgi:hypothetical protein